MIKANFSKIGSVIHEELNLAEKHIQIAVAWFTNAELFEVLCSKLKNGVKVELIIVDDFINNGEWGLNFQKFIDLGGVLYFTKEDSPLHHKFCVIDSETLITGSYNWTYFAEVKNYENVILIKENKEILIEFIGEFERVKSNLEGLNKVSLRHSSDLTDSIELPIKYYAIYDRFYNGMMKGNNLKMETALKLLPENSKLKKEFENNKVNKTVRISKYSFGIRTFSQWGENFRYEEIIPKGASIPVEKTCIVETVYDLQETMKIDVLINNKTIQLGDIIIDDLFIQPKGMAKVEVTFTLDGNEILKVVTKNIDFNTHIFKYYNLKNSTTWIKLDE